MKIEYTIDAQQFLEILSSFDDTERGHYILKVARAMCAGASKAPFIVKEPKKKETKKARNSEYTEEFEKFWKAYPSTVAHGKPGKGTAFASWQKWTKGNKPLAETILNRCLEALVWQQLTEQWTRDNGQYVPHPTTYLNQRRWEDDPPDTLPNKTVMGIEPSTTGRKMVL